MLNLENDRSASARMYTSDSDSLGWHTPNILMISLLDEASSMRMSSRTLYESSETTMILVIVMMMIVM